LDEAEPGIIVKLSLATVGVTPEVGPGSRHGWWLIWINLYGAVYGDLIIGHGGSSVV